MREEIRGHISWNYGPKAWEEVLQIEASLRKRRKDELYKKQERIDRIINWSVGIIVFVLGAAILGGIAWILGSYQGRW